ncbi:hypothetical protein L6R52_00940 [Myxococcota bacterium]|nr:hypothetical protein [Myxococcota bacterium]
MVARAVSLAALCAVTVGCDGPNGAGVVRAWLDVGDCRGTDAAGRDDFGFDAGYLATERYSGVLLIQIQEHAAEVEETDGLTIRLDLRPLLADGRIVVDHQRAQLVRGDGTRPLVVRTSTSPRDANVSLSLFGTCPEFPTSHAIDGQLVLDKLTLAEDPEDTGDGERLGGTVTATLARSSGTTPAGTLEATFDFSPPRRPLTDFR